MTVSRYVTVDAAFGFGPFDTVTEPDWVELVDGDGRRVREASWSIGRDSEFEHFPAGTATLLLRNRDRALDPDNVSSPYNGELVPLVPVRIRSVDPAGPGLIDGGDTGLTLPDVIDAGASTVPADLFDAEADASLDEFYGYVRNGWQQILAPKGTSDCRIELVDLLGVIAGYRLRNVFEAAVLDLDPVGFWVLDGSGAETVEDLGSGKNHGTVNAQNGGVTLGDRVIQPGHAPAAKFDHSIVTGSLGQSSFGYIDISRSYIIPFVAADLLDTLVVITFQVLAVEPAWRVLFSQGDSNLGGGGFQAQIRDTGILWYGCQNILEGSTATSVLDGKSHIMFGLGEQVGLDNATVSSAGGSVSADMMQGVGIGGGLGVDPVVQYKGWVGAVAVFADGATIGLAGRQTILDAYSQLDGETSDAHITWALDQLGVPAGTRNLDTGTVTMGPADTKDQDALGFMRLVAATEGGSLYVDHRDGGKIRFTNRYHRFLNSRSVTSQATFSDQPGTTHIRYPADGLDVAPNGLDGIVNQATVRWAGGEVTLEDSTSIAAYGPRQRTIETVATTPSQARSAGEWVVARYKDPRSRVRGATAADRATHSRDPRVEDLRIDDRVLFQVQPLHTGTATEVDLFVDGITHTAAGVEWETRFRFAPVDTFTPWIWGTSAWDTTAYWG